MSQNNIKPKFLVFDTKDKADKYVSDLIVKQINELPITNLGLPTGNTPLGIYKNLVDAYKSNVVSFKDVTTFNLDEFVGLNDVEYEKSYHFYMEKNLFNHVDINRDNTHFPIKFGFDVNANPNYDYVEYDRLIESKEWIDLMILGVGSNGHIAFNEPDTPYETFTGIVELSDSTRNALVSTFGNKNLVPLYGATVGLQTILYSRKIVLVAYGKQKANALYELFFNNEFNPKWPLTALNYHTDVTIVCDKEASEEIMAKKIA